MSNNDQIDILIMTISSIEQSIAPWFINSTISQIPDALKYDIDYLSITFCNDNGSFLTTTKTCDCDFAFFGTRCSTPGAEIWGQGWTWFQVLFSMFYCILAILTWVYLHKYFQNEYGSFCKKIGRLLQTPKYLVILNLLVICNTRIIYLTVDPFKQKGIFDRPSDRVLHELIFSSCVSIFFILLIVWMGLYTAFDIENKHKEISSIGENVKTKHIERGCYRYFNVIKQGIVIILFFIYPIQIALSYFRGTRNVDSATLDYILIAILGVIFIVAIVFIYYTCKFKYTLSKSYESPNKTGHKIFTRKPQVRMHKKTKKIKRKEMKEFLKSVEEKTLFNLIVSYIVDPDKKKQDDGDDSDSELDYEDEMRNIDMSVFEEIPDDIHDDNEFINNDEDFEINYIENPNNILNGAGPNKNSLQINHNPVLTNHNEELENERQLILVKNEKLPNNINVDVKLNPRISQNNISHTPIQRKRTIPFQGEKKEFVLTQYDMDVLNKIFGLSYLIIIVAIIIVGIGIVVRGSRLSTSPGGTIAIIIFSFIFETITIIAIFILFVKDIENKEYDNLKVIGEV